MSTCPSIKIDSNVTGLRVAVEECLKQLPSGPVAASGYILFTANPDDGDTVTVDGEVLTFQDSAVASTDVQIGSSAGETIASLRAVINSEVVAVASTLSGLRLDVVSTTPGVSGNSITLAASSSAISLSGPTLTGGLADAVVTWRPLEPNEYSDFGASITTVARNPINPSRQRKKGVVTDAEATAGYTSDMTAPELDFMLESFCFAKTRAKSSAEVGAVAAGSFSALTALAASAFTAGDFVFGSGFANSANNRMFPVTGVVGTTISVSGSTVVEATAPAGAKVQKVGRQFASGDVALTIVSGQVVLTATAGSFAALGLTPGEWIFVGGDTTATRLGANYGFARVDAISSNGKAVALGKIGWSDPVANVGTSVTLQIFVGNVIRNELDPSLIVRKSLQFERTMGQDADGTMSQYVTGAVANELTINVPQADKATTEFAFIGCESFARSGLDGLLSGVRPNILEEDAYNTSSDVRRLNFSLVGESQPLFVYATEMTLTINNNASGAKAIGVLGNADVNIGTFEVGGSATAYFQDVRAINAVRNNEDVTCDIILVKANAGVAFDIPLLALGNGMANVEADNPITLPLDTVAAQSAFGHTFLYVSFPYLPNVA